jgi:hypothetical protein
VHKKFDQLNAVKRAIPRVWTISPVTRVLPNKKKSNKVKHKKNWETK